MAGKVTSMTPEKIKLLDQHGFSWGKATKNSRCTWEDNLQRLVQFKAEFNHTMVPYGYPSDKALANWLMTQRQQYRVYHENIQNNTIGVKCSITEERINALNELGVVWKPKKGGGHHWKGRGVDGLSLEYERRGGHNLVEEYVPVTAAEKVVEEEHNAPAVANTTPDSTINAALLTSVSAPSISKNNEDTAATNNVFIDSGRFYHCKFQQQLSEQQQRDWDAQGIEEKHLRWQQFLTQQQQEQAVKTEHEEKVQDEEQRLLLQQQQELLLFQEQQQRELLLFQQQQHRLKGIVTKNAVAAAAAAASRNKERIILDDNATNKYNSIDHNHKNGTHVACSSTQAAARKTMPKQSERTLEERQKEQQIQQEKEHTFKHHGRLSPLLSSLPPPSSNTTSTLENKEEKVLVASSNLRVSSPVISDNDNNGYASDASEYILVI